MGWSLLLLFVLQTAIALCSAADKTLFFSFITAANSNQYNATGAIPAVDLALDRINSDPGILKGYKLNYTTDVGNSMCDRTTSLDEFFSRLFNSSQPQYVATLCCGCSVAAIPVAEISHHWNIPQMAYAAASLTLNDRSRFKSFFRTMPVYTNMGIAVAALAKTFGWSQLAVVTQSNGLFTPVLESLQGIAMTTNLRLDSFEILSTNPFPFEDLFQWDEDYRIIFINAYQGPTQSIACEAYKRGLHGSDYVWITVNWGEGWWIPSLNSTHNCTEEQIVTVINRGFSIIPSGFFLREDSHINTTSGITPVEFEMQYESRRTSDGYIFYSRFGLSYDAMWAIAIGLNTTLTRINANDSSGCEDVPGSIVPLENFEYSNRKMGCLMKQSFQEINFSGVTGEIAFNSNGSRINNIVTIRQYRRPEGSSQLVMVTAGVVEVGNNISNTVFRYEFNETLHTLWPDGVVPYDGSANDVIHPIAIPIIVIYDILAVAGIIFAVGCTIFNIVFRKKPVVKLSSPTINFFLILGAVLLYTSVFLYQFTADDDLLLQTAVCNLRQWISAIGYTLCFSVILSKTWRIYYIFNNPTQKKKRLRDWILLLIVGVVVLVDVGILFIGTAVPQIRIYARKTLDIEHPTSINDQGMNERNFIYICGENSVVWLSISYAYKGLLQLVAMFMAFHTRKVKIKALNDSKEIGAIVYINSIILVLLGVTELALRKYHYVYAALYGTALNIGGSLFLGLTFVPKMVNLYRDPDGENVLKPSTNNNNLSNIAQTVAGDNNLTDNKELRLRIATLEATITKMKGEKKDGGTDAGSHPNRISNGDTKDH